MEKKKKKGVGRSSHDSRARTDEASPWMDDDHNNQGKLMRIFFRDAKKHPMLTRAEEQEVCAVIFCESQRIRRMMRRFPWLYDIAKQHERNAIGPTADGLTHDECVEESEEGKKANAAGSGSDANGSDDTACIAELILRRCVLSACALCSAHDSRIKRIRLIIERADARMRQERMRLVEANLFFVAHIADRYRGRGLPFPDLIAEGVIGLMRAAEKFDPRRNLKFVTYAGYWVCQGMARAINNQGSVIRISSNRVDEIRMLTKGEDLLGAGYSSFGDAELAAFLQWPLKRLEEARRARAVKQVVYLDDPALNKENGLLLVTPDEHAFSPEALLQQKDVCARVRSWVDGLPERYGRIIALRFGIGDGDPRALQRIADLMGLSRERIRQLEKEAMGLLRKQAANFGNNTLG